MKSILKNTYRGHYIAVGLWLGVFIAYLRTSATAVGFIDSGELATVPYVLGIAHPTGYPLWTLVTHIFASLPIAQEEIVRLNIFCSLAASLAAALFYYAMLFLLRAGKSEEGSLGLILPAAFSALVLAFSRTFWDQSTSIEVYAFHLLLLSVVILCFLRAIFIYLEQSIIDQRWWFLFAFTLGLSFTNHLTTILLAPAFLYLYFSAFKFSKDGFRQILILAVPFILGLSVYIYFPMRAVQQPALNWGYPATLERILWHVSGKQYRVWMFSSTEAAAKQWGHFLNSAPAEFYYVPLLFSLLGAWRLLFSHKRILIFIALLLAGCIAYTVNYDINDIDSYFLLAYISLAMCAGFGAYEAGMIFKSKWGKSAVVIILAGVVIAEVSANWSDVDARNDYLVEDYTTTILTNLRPNAIIISYQWDDFVSASYYFQYVKHVRTDVTVIDKELLRRSWYFLQIQKDHPRLYERSKNEIESFLVELSKFEHDTPYDPAVIEARYNRMIDSFVDHNIDSFPIYIGPEIETHLAARYTRVPEGYVFRLFADTMYHPVEFPSIAYRPLNKRDKWIDQLRRFASNGLTRRGVYEMQHGKSELAQRYLQKAQEIMDNNIPER